MGMARSNVNKRTTQMHDIQKSTVTNLSNKTKSVENLRNSQCFGLKHHRLRGTALFSNQAQIPFFLQTTNISFNQIQLNKKNTRKNQKDSIQSPDTES